MLGLRHILRSSIRQSSLSVQLRKFSVSSTARNSSDDEDDGSGRKPKSKIDEKQKKAINKLNALLSAMVEEDKTTAATKMKSALSRPKRIAKKVVPAEQPAQESKVEAAARSAAASLGGNVEKTESDLLSRLRSQVAFEQSHAQPEEPIVQRSEESRKETARSLTSLLSAMQVEKKPAKSADKPHRALGDDDKPWERKGGERGGQRRGEWKERRGESDRYDRRPRMEPERVILFGKEALNIFKPDFVETQLPEMSTWQRCSERELRLASTHPPANHFEEMIQWTEQGKLWRFPIDNEQEMTSEKATSFTEHVFFDAALEGWCSSPEVRHFMELVCVGLSKNPYIGARDKLAHIEWFRNYFADKGHLIDGAIQETPQQAISQ